MRTFLTLVLSCVILSLSAQTGALNKDIINFSSHNGAVYEQHVIVEDGIFTELHWSVLRMDSLTRTLVVVEASIGIPTDEIEVCQDHSNPDLYWFDQEIRFDGFSWTLDGEPYYMDDQLTWTYLETTSLLENR